MRRLFAVMVLFIVSLPLSGWEAHNYDYIVNTSPWTSSRNASGLVTFKSSHIATANASFEKADGKFIGIEDSADCLNGTTSAASYDSISERLKAFGSISYSYYFGKNMGGPILMDPSYNPISFIESDQTTIGNKSRELYNLKGALSYKLSNNWAIGIDFSYESGLYAKRKDPRYRNSWMNMGVSAGAKFTISEKFSVGLSLIYEKTLEAIDGNLFGNFTTDYFNLIDYGGFYCKKEVFSGDSGYIPQSQKPRNMLNSFYGAAIQLEHSTKKNVFFHEIILKTRSGYYGNEGTSSIVYTNHDGIGLMYKGSALLFNNTNTQKLGLELYWESLDNNENIFRTNTIPGHQTVVEILGSKKVLERNDIHGIVYWHGWSGLNGRKPDWEYKLSAETDLRTQTTTLYPFYRDSKVFFITLKSSLRHNFKWKKNIISPEIGLSFSKGGGNPKKDGTLASSTSGKPISADNYLYKDFEYKTISSASISASLEYTRTINEKLDIYARFSNRYRHCIETPQYLEGRFRNIFTITIGCTF